MILEFLGQDGHRRSSLAQISNALGISKSSAYNVLKTLQDSAFVQFHPTGKRYSLGLALLQLGSIVADDLDYLSIARPYVHELAAEVQETCLIARWVEDRLVVLHCEEPLHDLRVTIAVGQQLRYVSGAFGKAYLAFSPADYARQKLHQSGLASLTPHSITDIEAFMRELERVRQNGYSESYEETRHGINGIAAPVFDKRGSVVLIVGLLGFRSNLPPDAMLRDGMLVRKTACSISAALGSSVRPGLAESMLTPNGSAPAPGQ